MKKIITFLALFSVVSFYAQNKIADKISTLEAKKTIFRIFTPLAVAAQQPTKDGVKDATYAVIDGAMLKEIAASKYDAIALDVPYNNGMLTIQLYRVNIAAEGFHVDTNKQAGIEFEKGAHYRGIIKGDPASVASFNFFKDEMSGIVSAAGINNLVVGKLRTANNLTDYIIYSDAKLSIPNSFTCSAPDPLATGGHNRKNVQDSNDIQSNRCVTIYFEIDHDVFLANSSSVAQTMNWMFSVFNNVQTLFENDGITVAIKSVFIWTEPDPYFGTTSVMHLLQFFEQRPVFDGDVGQLVSIDEGGLGGIAIDIAGLCTDNNVSYADINFEYNQVPLYSSTVLVITHELGHLLGSPHTHGCYWNGNDTAIDGCGTAAGYVEGDCEQGPIPNGGTIMSYCHLITQTDFSQGFGPQPAARILNHVNSSECLSTDCINTCINTVATITTTATSATSATISWVDESGSGPWEVAVAPFSGSFTNWQTATQNSFTFTGLSANTYYKFAVRPICDNDIVTSATSELIFATSGDYCSGLLFTDTGGPSGNYTDQQYLVRTIVPNVPGTKAIVEFTSFDLELDFDYMYVYDGATTDAPLLGAFTGDEIPGPFESTAPDGSLTFEFISDQFLTEAGWTATISCAALGTDENALTNFVYYPNPSDGLVNISAGEKMEELTVYNVTGQLLLRKNLNATNALVDISAFAKGVYLFRVIAGPKEMNFRIIRQ